MEDDLSDTGSDEELPPEEEAARDTEERAEQYAANSQLKKDAWQQTLDDLDALAEKHREDGTDVTAIAAVDAGPIGRDTNDPDGEYGMEFVIADNHVEEFQAAFEAGDYPEYDIYRGEAASDAFVVLELNDPDAERTILLAGAYPLRDETMCAYAAREEGEMYTYVRTLDGTRYGAFHHEGYRKFFPRADELPDDPAQVKHI
ncbi:DUF7529 family protein [Halobacterium bonnevillei]|uniref:Uncharacterized protein n=1 Tax=Halobacterium bonnevillei TaxID=2692200 RepID=A0A6B0SEH8_9EURY|nr:hypothetical protein [Halobacterium bonnevillei]MXR20125.1 hypothetical protein [Halobacterium bonnevillei]